MKLSVPPLLIWGTDSLHMYSWSVLFLSEAMTVIHLRKQRWTHSCSLSEGADSCLHVTRVADMHLDHDTSQHLLPPSFACAVRLIFAVSWSMPVECWSTLLNKLWVIEKHLAARAGKTAQGCWRITTHIRKSQVKSGGREKSQRSSTRQATDRRSWGMVLFNHLLEIILFSHLSFWVHVVRFL